eukprot:s2757_g13.t1
MPSNAGAGKLRWLSLDSRGPCSWCCKKLRLLKFRIDQNADDEVVIRLRSRIEEISPDYLFLILPPRHISEFFRALAAGMWESPCHKLTMTGDGLWHWTSHIRPKGVSFSIACRLDSALCRFYNDTLVLNPGRKRPKVTFNSVISHVFFRMEDKESEVFLFFICFFIFCQDVFTSDRLMLPKESKAPSARVALELFLKPNQRQKDASWCGGFNPTSPTPSKW